jgi:nicotinamidase-related amidase
MKQTLAKHSRRAKKAKVALLVIDMLNTLDFKNGKRLLKQSLPAAKNILKLKTKLKARGIPIIYVNDNFRALEI